jgi:hypothetical protein
LFGLGSEKGKQVKVERRKGKVRKRKRRGKSEERTGGL